MWRNVTIIALTAALVLVAALLFRQCDKTERKEQNIEALSDTLRTERDEKGRHVAKIKTIQGKNRNLLNELSGKSQYIQDLKERVEEYKDELQSATVTSSETSVSTSTETIVKESTDTVIEDSIVKVYPTYSAVTDQKWYRDSTVANRDSIHRDFTVYNQFSVVHGLVRKPGLKGFFQPKVPEVEVRDENPYTTIRGARSFRIDEAQKRFSLNFSVGYGFMMNSVDGAVQLRRGPIVSLNVGYDIIRF